jgi:hypothetical protein
MCNLDKNNNVISKEARHLKTVSASLPEGGSGFAKHQLGVR